MQIVLNEQIFILFISALIHSTSSGMCMVDALYMYYVLCYISFIITAPGVVPNVMVTCGPVDLINQCTVTWDVSNLCL